MGRKIFYVFLPPFFFFSKLTNFKCNCFLLFWDYIAVTDAKTRKKNLQTNTKNNNATEYHSTICKALGTEIANQKFV